MIGGFRTPLDSVCPVPCERCERSLMLDLAMGVLAGLIVIWLVAKGVRL